MSRGTKVRVTMLWLVLAAAGLPGCAGGSEAVAGAVINTAIAAGASAHSRAQGGCYAACPTGTACNTATGYCDPLPCRGTCRADEQCEQRGLIERCAPRSATLNLKFEQKPAEVPSPK